MPVIYSTPALGEAEMRVIGMLENLRSRIRAATGSDGTTRRWIGPIRRDLAARALVGSNSIEGINLTIDDAHALVAEEEPLDQKTDAWLGGQGYKRAMTYVLQIAEDPSFSYSENTLKSLHFMMLEHDIDKRPGRWRLGSIFVKNDASGEVVYEGPDIELVPGLIDELIQSLEIKSSEPGVVRAAMAHLNLVMIHPFKDGNGRMARCLQSLVLARTGMPLSHHFLSIEEYLGRFTQDYYGVLASTGLGIWNPTGDATEWVRFSLGAHFFQGSVVANRIKVVQRAWVEIEQEILTLGLSDRSVSPLIEVFLKRKIRNLSYRTAASVSEQVATNDLGRLVKAGFLEAVGEKKGRYYVRGPRLLEIRDRVYIKPEIPHPFRHPELAEEFAAEGLNRQPAQTSLSGDQGSRTSDQPSIAPSPPSAPPRSAASS